MAEAEYFPPSYSCEVNFCTQMKDSMPTEIHLPKIQTKGLILLDSVIQCVSYPSKLCVKWKHVECILSIPSSKSLLKSDCYTAQGQDKPLGVLHQIPYPIDKERLTISESIHPTSSKSIWLFYHLMIIYSSSSSSKAQYRIL